jgi:hypothetical protein
MEDEVSLTSAISYILGAEMQWPFKIAEFQGSDSSIPRLWCHCRAGIRHYNYATDKYFREMSPHSILYIDEN